MNKAFIFDFDGVIIDIEPSWEAVKKEMYPKILGADTYAKLGNTIGLTMNGIYEKAVQLGSSASKEALFKAFHENARRIYQTAPITPNLETLRKILLEEQFKVGLVTASPQEWIDIVFKRIPSMKIDFLLSFYERPEVQPKPHPEGYLKAIKALGATAQSTFILEDSNTGIASAKATGAYVIGLKQNLIAGYEQVGADMYADTIEDVIKIVLSKQ